MTDTPRTDAAVFQVFDSDLWVDAIDVAEAKAIERENAELKKLVERLKCCGNCEYANQDIGICEHPENSEDAILKDFCEHWLYKKIRT